MSDVQRGNRLAGRVIMKHFSVGFGSKQSLILLLAVRLSSHVAWGKSLSETSFRISEMG